MPATRYLSSLGLGPRSPRHPSLLPRTGRRARRAVGEKQHTGRHTSRYTNRAIGGFRSGLAWSTFGRTINSHRLDDRFTLFPLLWAFHLGGQLRQAHVDSPCYPVEVDDADVALSPLHAAHVRSVKPGLLDERLLGCISALP